jgi:hypothetical protein
MANELEIGVTAKFQKNDGRPFVFDVAGILRSVTGVECVGPMRISVATTEQALQVPTGLTLAGALFVGQNLDYVNYMEIRSATGATNDIIRVGPREVCLFRWGSDITAPYLIANTAAVLFDYGMVEL